MVDESLSRLAQPWTTRLCDACLGRLVTRLVPGQDVRRVGADLRGAAALPDTCWICEGLVDRVPSWVSLCLTTAQGYEFDTFLVGSVVYEDVRAREVVAFTDVKGRDALDAAKELQVRTNPPPFAGGEWLKTQINREVGKAIEAATGTRVDFDRPDLTFRLDTRLDHVGLQVADVFVRGRYRKFVRDLPQTRWPCRACGGIGCRQCGGTGKTYESSVEELVASPFLIASGAEGEAFHGMGREDIDARTLGTGRPFILELKRPRRRRLDWSDLQRSVNEVGRGRVEVEGIGPAGPQEAARYKAADPAKTYHAACEWTGEVDRGRLEAALARLSGAALEQRTPQRVAHRRADLVRHRRVRQLRLLSFAPPRFTIEIVADSGTYIKEFVSGDEGRTMPNLSATLGASCKVVELDVVDVDWRDGQEPPAEAPSPGPSRAA